jgi:hypothetical protein
MNTQIFKKRVPINLLFAFLDLICEKDDKSYILTNDAFKKGQYHNMISPFLASCIEYYHISKRTYLERKITYNSLLTVIRQICKNNEISYSSQIKYDKSHYSITYRIVY